MTAASNIIVLMTNLVASMTPLVTIDTNIADGTNWKLSTCNTYWLSTGHSVTIGGEAFTVVSFAQNSYIIVSGTAQPIGTTFLVNAPLFQHGSHRKVKSERRAPNDVSIPFVYLPKPTVREDLEYDSDIAYTASINPFFLMSFDPDWDEINLQQVDIIDPLNAMADLFETLIKADMATYEDLDFVNREEWMNFGNNTIWGNDKLIFEDDLSGVELTLDLGVSDNDACLCDGEPVVTCAPVDMTFNTASITSTPAGQSKTIVVQTNDIIPVPAGTVILDDENNLTIEVAAVMPILNTANLFKTGAVTSYQSQDDGDKEFGRGTDFDTLAFNNGFGTLDRFTDDLGTQIYVTGVIIDWSTWDQTTDTVGAYFQTPEANANLTTHISNQPFTKNALSDWWVCNYKQIVNVMNMEITRNYLNYAPFNFDYASSTTNRIWCSTRDSAAVGIFLGNTSFTVASDSGSYKALVCRTYSLTELPI